MPINLTCSSKLNPILFARGWCAAPAAAAAAKRLIAGGAGLGPPDKPPRCSPKPTPCKPLPWDRAWVGNPPPGVCWADPWGWGNPGCCGPDAGNGGPDEFCEALICCWRCCWSWWWVFCWSEFALFSVSFWSPGSCIKDCSIIFLCLLHEQY